MTREFLTDEQIEAEINRLSESEYVRLARKENRLKVERQRKKLYSLRSLEKRGKELADMGVTLDNIKSVMFDKTDEKATEDED